MRKNQSFNSNLSGKNQIHHLNQNQVRAHDQNTVIETGQSL